MVVFICDCLNTLIILSKRFGNISVFNECAGENDYH